MEAFTGSSFQNQKIKRVFEKRQKCGWCLKANLGWSNFWWHNFWHENCCKINLCQKTLLVWGGLGGFNCHSMSVYCKTGWQAYQWLCKSCKGPESLPEEWNVPCKNNNLIFNIRPGVLNLFHLCSEYPRGPFHKT